METIKKQCKLKCLSNNSLKIIAMCTMFMDHMGKSLFHTQDWMTYIGRLAFPIFAFLIAEGYNHTKDYKTYLKRLAIYALISEIPYNLMYGSILAPGSQNVLFTFIIALIVIRCIDKSWEKHWGLGIVIGGGSALIGYIAAFLLGTDYFGYGVLTVVCFWVFGKIKYGWILQLVSIAYINWKMIAGISFTIVIREHELWIPVQAIAILSMIPIFMYNGKLGRGGKKFQKFAYLFYPMHMAILGLLMIIGLYL